MQHGRELHPAPATAGLGGSCFKLDIGRRDEAGLLVAGVEDSHPVRPAAGQHLQGREAQERCLQKPTGAVVEAQGRGAVLATKAEALS